MNKKLSRILKVGSLAAALAVALSAAGSAQAYPHGRHGHGHGRIGVWIGSPGPFWWGAPYGYAYRYGYPYPERPLIIEAPAEPVVAAPAQQSNTWYYCREAQMYYPYVSHCPSPWQEVPATPPAPAR